VCISGLSLGDGAGRIRTMNDDTWRRARKRPVEVEFRGPYTDTDTIDTLEGDFEIDENYINEHGGYVVIRGVDGEVYPCGLDIFRETYEVFE